MGPDASNVVGSIAKSLELDRSPGVTQRASDVSQDQLAGESVVAMGRKKADAADELRRARIRQEHERKRREMERRAREGVVDQEVDEDSDGGLDVVV